MSMPVLTVSSKNYSSWALRGWLLCKMSGLEFEERKASVDDASMRAELLLLSPSCLVPCLEHMGIKIWNTFAIAEYLNEIKPKAGLYPAAAPGTAGTVTSATGAPDTRGWIAELNYLPWLNTKFSFQYTKYTKFNGGSTNYDGVGRNASDNDTLYFLLWFSY